MSDIIAAALALAADGLKVFPCDYNKHPLVKWKEAATSDADKVRIMFGTSSAAMIGVPTGHAIGGIVAVDIDRKNGKDGQIWWDANRAALGDTRIHSTMSGGYHLIYRMPDGVEIRNSASDIAPGVDVRGEGGYVIWPPSEGYTLANDSDVAELPEFIVKALSKPVVATVKAAAAAPSYDRHDKYVQRAIDGEVANVTRSANGTRNDVLNKAAFALGQFVGAGVVSRSTVEAELTRAAHGAGMDERKDGISATIKSGVEAGMLEPREIPENARPEPVEDIHPAQGLIAKANGAALERRAKQATSAAQEILDGIPDGSMLRMFVDYCLSTAYSPQPFLALAGGLALAGTLAGRRYASPSDLRTNLFLISLANSGSGKDQPRKCAKAALGAAGLTQYLGGESLASTQGIFGSIEVHPVRLFQFDEFGKMIEGLVAKNVAGHKAGIIPALTTLWSSASTYVPGSEYAKQTGKDGNPRLNYEQPHLCVNGSTVASVLWNAMRSGNASDGSLARYIVFETENNYPDLNHTPARVSDVPPELVERMQAMAAGVPDHDYGGNLGAVMQFNAPMLPYFVPYGEGVEQLIREWGDECKEMNRQLEREGKPGAAFVSRIVANTISVALTSAVARKPEAPVIEVIDAVWARKLVGHCSDTAMRETATRIADTSAQVNKNRIVELLVKAGKDGMTKSQLIRRTQWLDDSRQRDRLLEDLMGGDLVIAVKMEGGTKPTWTYHAAAF